MKITDFINEAKDGLPVKTLKGLYHVGTLDASKKRDGFEGAGLSVSTHPDAWKQIARGHVTGDTHSATKEGNKFLDAHGLSDAHNEQIKQWALENDYLAQQETVTVCYYDDEMEDDLCSTFNSMADAEAEYDEELEHMDVSVDKGGIVPTDKLKKETRQNRIESTGVLEFVLPIFAEQQGLDGVWWQDKLDVNRYSAPRGVIVPSKIKSWKFAVNETAGVGKITKQNTTPDVKPGETERQAKKFFPMNKNGKPKPLGVKGATPNQAFNLGMTENISVTGTERGKQARKKKLRPGSEAWFKHWFSLPLMKRESFEQAKAELIEHIDNVRSAKDTATPVKEDFGSVPPLAELILMAVVAKTTVSGLIAAFKVAVKTGKGINKLRKLHNHVKDMGEDLADYAMPRRESFDNSPASERFINAALQALHRLVTSKGKKQSVGGYAFDIARAFDSINARQLEDLYHEKYGVTESVNEATEMKISDLTISDAGMAIAQSVGGGSRTDAPLAVTKLPSGHVYLVNGYHRLVDAMQAGKDTVSVKYVPYEKVEILWKQEREQDIKYGKQFNEESEIWQWNKEDPNNPEVHIQGYGRLMLNQIEDSIVGKLKELTKMAERGDFEQIQSLLDRDVMQSMMKAVVDTKAELQATRKRGGPKSRGINRESILDVIGKSEIKELDLKEFTLNRETSVKEEEKKNDLLKGFDPRTERALMMLKAKYPQADNILSALLADVENNEEDSDIADLSHELKMDKLLKAVEVLQKEINLLKGGKKLNVVKETGGVGKIVPGINTTVDVGPNEITKQAAKFGNKVSKDGLPKKTFRRK